MPMYDFRCVACGSEFEELVRSSADTKGVTCPECGSADVSRGVSAPCVLSGSSGVSSAPPSGGGCSASSPFT